MLICTLIALACMPLGVLYVFSDIWALVLYYVVRYRRKVVRKNLQKVFPSLQEQELRKIERRYYHHLCDLFAEGLYNLRAKPENIVAHYRLTNRELVDRYYEEGRSVVLLSSHFNNWEYMITTLNGQLHHHGVGVGKPLNNKRLNGIVNRRRARWGTEIVDQTDVREVMAYYAKYGVPVAYMMLSDQSPSNPHKSYWTPFFGQDTAFLYGAEHFARKYDMAVVYYEVEKVSRGYYEVTFREFAPHVSAFPEGAITQRYAELQEQTIRKAPEYWLWSHRRWKLTHDGRIMKNGNIKVIK